MSPPASERAEPTTRDVRTTPHVAPQPRGADGAARHPYPRAKHIRRASTSYFLNGRLGRGGAEDPVEFPRACRIVGADHGGVEGLGESSGVTGERLAQVRRGLQLVEESAEGVVAHLTSGGTQGVDR